MVGVSDRVLGTLGDPHRPTSSRPSGGRVALLSAERWPMAPSAIPARGSVPHLELAPGGVDAGVPLLGDLLEGHCCIWPKGAAGG
jgi:hypothetical protein